MPIRPENKHRYPKNWQDIRHAILRRAGQRSYWSYTERELIIEQEALCECRGECGGGHMLYGHFDTEGRKNFPNECQAPNHTVVHRSLSNPEQWHELEQLNEDCAPWTRSVRIVLTIAHLDHMPENNDPENLRALCQLCHLRYDREHHAKTRSLARLNRQLQLPLRENTSCED